MAVVQGQFTKANSDIHLRDWRHARNLYYEYGLAFAPKTKFLYHCLFEPSPEIGNSSNRNAFAFQKHLGVLAKSVDLPSFRVSVENKKQYNRIKNFQTRIDYNDINVTFHDDNLGVTRALFEEYYKYYWIDGNHNIQKNAIVSGPYATRDKYSPTVPKYGLNNGKEGPFFSSITIYQLARQQFFAYTLVNPIVTQWNHGNVAADDASGLNENTMSIAYEAVLYTNGDIGDDSQPVAFADQETGYDPTPSILTLPDKSISAGPKLLEPVAATESALPRNASTYDEVGVNIPVREDPSYDEVGSVYTVPRRDSQVTTAPVQPPAEDNYTTKDGARLRRSLRSDSPASGTARKQAKSKARKSFAAKAINAGELPYDNYTDFVKQVPSKRERDAIIDGLVDDAATGDAKLANMASEAMTENGVK